MSTRACQRLSRMITMKTLETFTQIGYFQIPPRINNSHCWLDGWVRHLCWQSKAKVEAMDRSKGLDTIFNPRSVAIVGATENPTKMGNWCVNSLLDIGYQGKIFPINPKRKHILGIKAYASPKDIPERIDLAIVVVQAIRVPQVLTECAEKGAKGAVIISSGFREKDDPGGPLLEKEVIKIAHNKGIRIIGPNTFGMVHTHARLNASFSAALCNLKKGHISMIGQSGGVSHLFMFSAIHDGVGLNKVVGVGNRADVDFAELVDYLDHDPGTSSIALYIEGLEDPGPLLEKVKSVFTRKPIVALKGGKTEAIKKASMAHTGAMAGNYDLYQASFYQSGMIAVQDPVELLDVARALSTFDPPRGDRIAVLSIQAGPGILMTDLCIEKGLSLAQFERKTIELLQIPWPNMTIRTNPVDLGFALTPEPFQAAIKAVLLDPNVDAILLGLIDPSNILAAFFSEELTERIQNQGKPVVVSYVSGQQEEAKRVWEDLERKGILCYPLPYRAVNALAGLVQYGRVLMEQNGNH